MSLTDPDRVLAALTGRMTGAQLAERINEPTREVVPILASLYRDGRVARFVDERTSVACFAPLAKVTVLYDQPVPQGAEVLPLGGGLVGWGSDSGAICVAAS
jgi:hypothetical protein